MIFHVLRLKLKLRRKNTHHLKQIQEINASPRRTYRCNLPRRKKRTSQPAIEFTTAKAKYTPKTNIASENWPSQKETIVTSIPTIHFQVRAVSFREGSGWKTTFLLNMES